MNPGIARRFTTAGVLAAAGYERSGTGWRLLAVQQIGKPGRWFWRTVQTCSLDITETRRISTPRPARSAPGFAGMSCTSAIACTAVGVDAASDFAPPGQFAETWDGTRWRLQATPVPPGTVLTELFTVSCPVPVTCTAVGTIGGQSMVTVTLALRTG